MSEPTKACNLTEDEVKELLKFHGLYVTSGEYRIERINYLNKRLKAFKEVEVVFEKEIDRTPTNKSDGW